MFLHICILVFAKYGLNFVLVKGITTVMVLRHLLYAYLTNFEFVGVAWAHVRTITSQTSFNLKLFCSLQSFSKIVPRLDHRLWIDLINNHVASQTFALINQVI